MTMTAGSRIERERLAGQALVYKRIRGFFDQRGLIEVQTPALSSAGTTDRALDSLSLRVRALGDRTQYLHTSPELPMKRLLASGSGDIYQVCRVFRDGELGRWHQPEFTLLEWYRVGYDEFALMDEVYELLRLLLAERLPDLEQQRLSYAEAFEHHLGIDPHRRDPAGKDRLLDRLVAAHVDVPQGLSHDGLLDLALSSAIVPALKPRTASFVYDYPASQAALAAIKAGEPPVAARFEIFIEGLELGNGFYELTDAGEQRRRFEAEQAARRKAGRQVPPLDQAFLQALEAGLPPCAGVAVGVDRLCAIAAGVDKLADVVSFPHRRN